MFELRYPLIHITIPESDLDEVSALLFELGAQGVEEHDTTTFVQGPGSGKVVLIASFPSFTLAQSALSQIDPAWSPYLEELIGDAWKDTWKEHYKPFAITSRITIRPPWEVYTPSRPDELVLEMEPGRAFGTGLHATTKLVARALEQNTPRLQGKPILDVGTGSGVLSFIALLLGARNAVAIDIDSDSILTMIENAARNHLTNRIQASTLPLEDVQSSFPVVVANIESGPLVSMAPALLSKVEPDGLLVLSGILYHQEEVVKNAYSVFECISVEREGEWISLSLAHH